MIMSEMRDFAFFPFLEEARQTQEFGREDLLSDEVISRAKSRILNAISNGEVGDPHDKAKVELLSYPLARIIVSLTEEYRLISQYSNAEASTAIHRSINMQEKVSFDPEQKIKDEFGIHTEKISESEVLSDSKVSQVWAEMSVNERRDFIESISDVSPDSVSCNKDNIEDVFNDGKALPTWANGGELFQNGSSRLIPVNIYLKYAPDKTEFWSLTNQSLINGSVRIMRHEEQEIVEEAIAQRVGDNLPLENADRFEDQLESQVTEIMDSLPDYMVSYDIDRVDENCFPPVIEHLIGKIREGKKIDHMKRFTVASFLINIGMDNEEILEILGIQNAPDYAKDATLYQVNHIREGSGDGESYTPPTYDTIESWGTEWTKDELESKVSHPLLYYRRMLEKADKESNDDDKNESGDENEN